MSRDDGYSIVTTDPDAVGIIADWFEEQGRAVEAESFRVGAVDELTALIGDRSFLSGSGWGSGSGSGWGWGWGSGSGSGWGLGLGMGSDSGLKLLVLHHQIHTEFPRMNEAVIGHNYLIFLPFGLVYVGRFVKPTGLCGGTFERVSNVHDTHNGASWADLARGKGRERAEFRPFDGVTTFPSILAAHPWAGELPGWPADKEADVAKSTPAPKRRP